MLQKDFKKLLNEGEVKFQFTKKNGKTRDARGTTNLGLIPEANHPKGTGYTEPDDTVRFFDLDKNAWRSLCWDSFIGVAE